MKKILFLLAAMAVFIACSKDDDNDDFFVTEEQFEIYQQAYDDATEYIKKNSPNDINIVAEYVKTIHGVTDVQQTDNILYVTIDDALKFIIDFNTYPEYEPLNVTVEEINQIIDSIDNALETNRASGYLQTSEVFKDYLSHNQSSASRSTITRSSLVKLSKRNVLIWNPWSEFARETDQIKTIVSNANNHNHIEVRNNISPLSFQDFEDYDLVYLSSHGSNDGSVIISKDSLPIEQLNDYLKEIVAHRVIYSTNKFGECLLVLTDKFFDKYLPDLSNTIVWASACFLGTQNSKFMKNCFDKNVADYFAPDTFSTSYRIIENFKSFYPKLMNGYSTDRAFANGNGYFKGLARVGTFNIIKYKFSRYGNKIVYYPKPVATGVGKQSNESRSTTRSGVDASTVIVNAQLRYSSEEKDDILKVTESGICLLDLETNEVKLIPFTSNNIVSNEKKTYGDVTVSNIAASLDDLIEGHKYAYCCYTKVDGIITLSDETYKFSKTENYNLILYYTYDYKVTLYSRDGAKDEGSGKGSKSEIFIAKYNGEYYFKSSYHSNPHRIHWSYDEPLSNSVKNWSAYNQEGVGSMLVSINSDNVNIKCYCDNYNKSEDNSHFDAEISVSNMDTEPILSLSTNHYESHTNRFGLFKRVWEYNYTYTGYERKANNSNNIWLWYLY